MSELGRIEKPAINNYTFKRKLYCVPNVIPFTDGSDEYTKLLDKYWEDVLVQLEKLNIVWKIKKVFCENIYVEGQDALNVLENTNKKAFEIVQAKIKEGALVVPIENKELLGLFIDWRNCLSVVRTVDVFRQVYNFYMEVLNNRLQHIQDVIDKNLPAGEASLLLMEDEMRSKIQFSSDIEVFLVRPPSYDDLIKWLRNNL